MLRIARYRRFGNGPPPACTNLATSPMAMRPPGITDATCSAAQDVVGGAEREAGDVLGPGLRHDEDVVLAVAARAGLALRDREHRLHGDDHAGLEHRVDVLAQLDARL